MKKTARIMAVFAVLSLLTVTFMESAADARIGGGRSSGSRGSRSYSAPAGPSTRTSPYQTSPSNPGAGTYSRSPYQQQPGGGFLRSMAGGIMGGMLGGMLFRSLGFGGGGAMGGGGIGLFEILLLAGIGYLIYRFVKKNRETAPATYGQTGYQGGTVTPISRGSGYEAVQPASDDVTTGLSHIRQMDPSFDEQRFNDGVMDMFFKVQGAWMNRDLSPVNGIFTDEMRRILQEDVERLLRDRQVNRLENIAVRNVEIAEVWQESGQDFITAQIYANLLDYTTDDATGAVVSGSKTEPVKFEEYWTFTRPVGNNQWRLSAINQK
ncbi:Tim44 domain-containing protein [Geotalea toluenoxydans]|uniref:Tim44 domain-containing protein n=1 Tax=Geotalea toluenoxydans TaxID=421624 RepID=UPI0006D19B04|nr:Tim44 domain-containing protein [Geotalea toluenoxydans]